MNISTSNLSDTLRWGIIGCGDVTERKSGPAFYKSPSSALAAVMRRDADKARDYAQRHGVAHWYVDAQQLIDDPEVDAVYVATPPVTHEYYTIAALQAGKPVYVEKPMAIDVAACKRMLQASQATDVKLCVAHYRRAVPMFAQIRQWLLTGEIGEVRTVRISMLQADKPETLSDPRIRWRVTPETSGPGGHFYDIAPHQLDLMLHFFGAIRAYHGFSVNQAGSYPARDAVCGAIEFSSGVLLTGLWAFTVHEAQTEDLCEIQGTKGIIRFPFFGQRVEVIRQGVRMAMAFEHPEHIQQPMIERVNAYFKGEAPNPCSAEEALTTLRIMEQFASQG
ncbi:MAG: Gfo/Idh/MocA family oxidoreductase [Bacteroidetes bacterium]|nr:Gfo/Idh/MocA family oxidoreductase [Bacteroidota bacterium]